jgi:hypothetical protein
VGDRWTDCERRALEHAPTVEAELLLNERHRLTTDAFVELRVWRMSQAVPGSGHDLKYALAYVVAGTCVLRYDNEAGKGDHRHRGPVQMALSFSTPAKLLEDFWSDVDQWRPE